ncbi:MAG: FAD-binding oxidoreductase [Bacteroidetes bacterium]|nr:FAD-binding oxidoreductase [Bacteroidota bacterium]
MPFDMSAQDEFKPSSFFEYILTYHRGLFATIFLLPVSVVYSFYLNTRNRIVFLMHSAPAKHTERVKRVQQQMMDWAKEGSEQKLCTARSGWFTMSDSVPGYKQTHRNISVNLHDILDVNEQHRVVRVEPLATMGQITATLNPLGWTLPVVPELDDLTVGGLINGFGVESSSHKYGLFQFICESFEIVTADGTVAQCSKNENVALFYAIPWSHGTLGFLVSATLKIIPAKKYVKLHYQPVYSLDELTELFERESRGTEKNQFVEALMYGQNSAVVMTGVLTDERNDDTPINSIGYFWKPFFYRHAEKYLLKKKTGYEYIPLRDYYHRHTRGLFWEMESIIPFSNQSLFRYLLGWSLPPKIPLLKYTETETTRRLRDTYHVVQDMLMPMVHLKKSLLYFHEQYNIYPIWLSPMAIYDNEKQAGFIHPYQLADGSKDPMFVDVGAYGNPMKRPFDGLSALRELEKFVIENKGYQALYAKTLMSREQFRTMFDHSDYDKLREELPLCTHAFNEVYDKVSSKARLAPVDARRGKV